MRVLIADIDGYLGWPLAQYLAVHGFDVGGTENFIRRKWMVEMVSWCAIPIPIFPMKERLLAFKECFNRPVQFWVGAIYETIHFWGNK